MVYVEDIFPPFRDQLTRYSCVDSLLVVHAYIQNLQFNRPMPDGIQVDPVVARAQGYEKHYFEWELDLLSRELIQHAPLSGRHTLRNWGEFANTLNALKDIEGAVSRRTGELLRRNILIEMGRNAYRQFHWQRKPDAATLARYYKIFGQAGLDAIIEREIGLTARELYIVGMALTGHFLNSGAHIFPIAAQEIGISPEKMKSFLRRFSAPLSTLKQLALETQAHNEDFAYSRNPLTVFPLVHAGLNGRHCVIAPIPTLLFDRFTAGVYYEIVKHPEFAHAFGNAFQRYVGEVLEVCLSNGSFAIYPECEYHLGKNRKNTVDWIVSDCSGNMFFECKTKRMRSDSKMALADTSPLLRDLLKISDFVVQIYKSIQDAKDGHYPNWAPNDKPVYPLVVLLDEFYLFDAGLAETLNARISEKLLERNINPSILISSPYTIVSCADLEILMQVIAERGVQRVMDAKKEGEKSKWNMGVFLSNEFKSELDRTGELFPTGIDEIHPVLAQQ